MLSSEQSTPAVYPRTAILAAYFGKLPEAFPAWLTSCGANPAFDWLVFTDDPEIPCGGPKNVRILPLSLGEFRERMSAHLGFQAAIQHPYKTCDFKPLYWVLLDLVPERYDFWGHCDLDMIFGDLAVNLRPSWFQQFDRILSVGHLSLHRNCEAANYMYRAPHPEFDWRSIFANPRYQAFDEHCGVNKIWKLHRGRILEDESIVADVSPHFSRFELLPPARNFDTQVLFYERGKVLRGRYQGNRWKLDEFAYIHFQKRAMNYNALPAGCQAFYITPSGLIPRREEVPSPELVRSLNPPAKANWSTSLFKLRQHARYLSRTVWA